MNKPNSFQSAWDSLVKDFYFDQRSLNSAGRYVPPKALGTTQIDDVKGRRRGWKGRLFDRDQDPFAMEEPEDGNPSSKNTVLEGDAFDEMARLDGRRFDTKPYNAEERQERGENEMPNDPTNPTNFRRGGSLPRTQTRRTSTPQLTNRYVDMDGNTMHPQYTELKEGQEGFPSGGGFDRTGKRFFGNDSNKPRYMEGQDAEYKTHVGANLAAHGTSLGERWYFEGEKDAREYGEDDVINDIVSTLGHEQVHSAIDEPLKDAINSGELPPEHYPSAHEIGAHIGQYAHLDDDKMKTTVNESLYSHPSTDPRNRRGLTPQAMIGMENRAKMPKMARSSDDIKQASFDQAWSSITKGRFRGYTQSNIGDRPVRQGKAKAWGQSRKVKRGRTRARYARNKSRGTVRPAMRRQLGAGGARASTKR